MVEELNLGMSGLPKSYRKKMKSGTASRLDEDIIQYLHHLYFIIIKEGMQIIYYRYLHNSPHYSVTLNEYCDMIEYAQRIHIRGTIFEPGINYFSPNKCNVMVMNNFKYEKDSVGYMKQQPTKLFMLKKTSIDKKRNVRARHVSPSSSIANAWTKTVVGTIHNLMDNNLIK